MKKLLSTILAVSLIITATACSTSGADNRETVDNRETKSTVNPDISEPNQSIASGALITETTTAPTSKKNGATYVINGVEFTISKAIEDYLYTLPGSDSKYIDLDGFMAAYGFSRIDGEESKTFAHLYENNDGMRVGFDNSYFSFYNNDGLGICKSVFLSYPSGAEGGQAACVYLSSDYPTDLTDGVYGVNAVSKDDKIWVRYCVSRETLVVIAVLMDYSNSAGSNAGARDALSKAIDANGTGGGFEYVIK